MAGGVELGDGKSIGRGESSSGWLGVECGRGRGRDGDGAW